MSEREPKTLPWPLMLENAILFLAQPWTNFVMALATVQWIYNTWQAEICHRKERGEKNPIPHFPVSFTVFNYMVGDSCADIVAKLNAYGISTQSTSLYWEVWPEGGGIGMYYSFLIPARQAWMADVVLRWSSGGETYTVESKPIYDEQRGDSATYAASTEPWAWRGKVGKPRSFHEAIDRFLIGLFGSRRTMKIKLKGDKKPRTQKREERKLARKRKVCA
ncbi:MAG TPA: hypothetical protein P5282_07015 [Anaerolineaceae bacterium]|nr:hypothetical protein [Myxococcota bacterium]HRS74674.1 hypothetical protein [Anaerolineaceae bacterium]HRV18454.1 hypothetical protein [Myxococcota bacterium]